MGSEGPAEELLGLIGNGIYPNKISTLCARGSQLMIKNDALHFAEYKQRNRTSPFPSYEVASYSLQIPAFHPFLL